MREPASKTVLRYGLAVTAVAAVLVTTLVQSRIQSPLAFNAQLCLIAIAITFWYAGTGPGLVALVLSCTMVSLLFKGHIIGANFALTQFTAFTVFFSLLILWFSDVRRRAERLLTEARDNLERRVAERTAKLQEANSELQKTEAYLAEAQRLSHTGSWSWSPDTDVRYWSEECYRVLGFDPRDGAPRMEELIQRIHPDDQPGFRESASKGRYKKLDEELDYRIVHPGGAVRDIHSIGHPVLSTSGHLIEFVGTVIDITEPKRAEQERAKLRQLETDLAHINRVSTLGEMAASLAHEVKQPIAAARNNARAALNFLAKKPPDLGEVKEALACIVGDADRAGDIIDRIRAHTKKAPPRMDRFDLNEALTEVVELARSEIAKNGVAVQTRLVQEVAPVRGDRVQLQQVMLNLILNAIEAMGSVAGPRELLISTEQRQTNGVVSVRDSGPGIGPEERQRVFEAFYTTKSNGVGIGLSICRSIIDAHGGRLWSEANEPRGATFQFTVPSAE
jgi:C4-dicarboxylate-specific signal transduction histidine kinase